MLESLIKKRVLLLQGPMGPFFRKLDNHLRKKGAITYRICFNGGDRFFANKDNRHDYTEKPDSWKAFISRFYADKNIDAIILYGDCRLYHRIAVEVATRTGIQVFVFEEGYVRPNFVTLEKNGVNAQSALPRDDKFYRNLITGRHQVQSTKAINCNYQRWAFFSILYFLAMQLWRSRYPYNRHHRCTKISPEIVYGIRNAIRKIWFSWSERPFVKTITNGMSGKYFLVPLQVQYDFQITRHSNFRNMQDFIRAVMVSFAKWAPDGTYLVFKHHPMDRGRPLYYRYIRKLARRLNIAHRVRVVHDAHLPTCLKNAIGTVTINSTVGISSLFHGTPTIVLGQALYDIEGLTCKDMPLDDFWSGRTPPDKALFKKFRNYLIEKTQLHGSFYGGFPA
jgi:capsular polysaccharide export protein